jgi:hypothetical protein
MPQKLQRTYKKKLFQKKTKKTKKTIKTIKTKTTKTTKKTKKTKKTKTKIIKIQKNLKNIVGGGLLDMVIREEKDKSTALPFGLSKYDPSTYLKTSTINPNQFRIIYNYGSPYQIDLTFKQNQVIPSSNVVNKPHLFMPNMNHYIIALVEHPGKPNSRLLWLSSYKNRSWEHDILSYMPPSPKQGQIRSYALLVFKYPIETNVSSIYKPVDMTVAKRKDELVNFKIYLAANKNIQPMPGMTKYFSVQYNIGNALSFISNIIFGKQNKRTPQNKLAAKQQYREQQKSS